jgi:hypothetical protein
MKLVRIRSAVRQLAGLVGARPIRSECLCLRSVSLRQPASEADHPHRKVSFLSRFIGGNKKKSTLDGTSDNGSEPDDSRHEGTNAQLYVNNLSFSPRIPHPPAYIKVRAKFKKEKEFDRVFLAQELRSGSGKKSPPAAGSNPAPQSGSAATQNPIWAVEFSKDGRYLAVGGQDRVIRVWAVIDSPERRRAHENTERDPHAHHGEASHLSAPVFQQKPIREYQGHTSTILDLSWSKVCCRIKKPAITVVLTSKRTISSYPHQWTRLFAYGM